MIKFKRLYNTEKVEQAIKEVIKQPEIVEEIKEEVVKGEFISPDTTKEVKKKVRKKKNV